MIPASVDFYFQPVAELPPGALALLLATEFLETGKPPTCACCHDPLTADHAPVWHVRMEFMSELGCRYLEGAICGACAERGQQYVMDRFTAALQANGFIPARGPRPTHPPTAAD